MLLLADQSTRMGHPVLGIIIPALVLMLSVVLTWLLYKKFSKKLTTPSSEQKINKER